MLTYSQTQNIPITLASRALNILLAPTGDGDLLNEVSGLIKSTQTTREGGLIVIIPLICHVIFSGLIQYVFGHILKTLCILESAQHHQSHAKKPKDHNKAPIFRNLSAVRLLYQVHGIGFIFKGLYTGVLYQVDHYILRSILQKLVFRGAYLAPVAYTVSSVLLSEVHLLWTHGTIAVDRGHRWKVRDLKRWECLSGPALLHAVVQCAMEGVSSGLGWGLSGASTMGVGRLVGKEILAALIMLCLRMVGFLSSITRTLVEVNFIPRTEETIVPSGRGRGVRVEEVLDVEGPLTLTGVFGRGGIFRVSMLLAVVELHLKKCFVRMVLECFIGVMIWACIYLDGRV